MKPKNEKDRVYQEQLDIRRFQLLRTAIHNEIVKVSDDRESDMNECKR